ncbi:MAG: HNH endonuclease [Actinomycetia bacterium]|nr:HNH endonuclease [Actinomycetes bacterium]
MRTATDLTTDTLEQQLLVGEATIASVRAAQMTIIREIDRRQTPLADGCRSTAEWVTGRLDVAPETAKTLVSTARRLEALPTVEIATQHGSLSFDRTVALARIAVPSEDQTIINELSVYDIAAIRRLRSNRHRMSRDLERETFDRRYLVAQPNLDESSWRVYGLLPAMAGRTFVEALDQKADQLLPGSGDASRTTRYADALWAISLDSLAGSDGATIESAAPLLTVFIDAHDATPTNAEAGVVVEAGPRVGPATVEAILCDGIIEVTGRTEDGTPVNMGRRSRTIPPRLRRFILARDGGVCTIEGCVSRYRLQPHHIRQWSQGGSTDAENLTTLCWFHHHVVIHGRGFTIDPSSPRQRRRLLRPPIHAPPCDW